MNFLFSLSAILLTLCTFFFALPLSAENLKIVNLQGKLKSNKKLASELSFDFCIESVGKFKDSFSLEEIQLYCHCKYREQLNLAVK